MEKVNFGMIATSLRVASVRVQGNHFAMTGRARSISTVNNKIAENAVYEFTVTAVDGGPAEKDTFGMTLKDKGLKFEEWQEGLRITAIPKLRVLGLPDDEETFITVRLATSRR